MIRKDTGSRWKLHAASALGALAIASMPTIATAQVSTSEQPPQTTPLPTAGAAADPVLGVPTTPTPGGADSNVADTQDIVVTGYRAALSSALNQKRNSNAAIDVINAEDIADFPDANLAESLQRLPGVALDRDNGEGRQITVRGLGSDFTRVRLNGLEALSTAGGSSSGDTGNRSRGFDFNTFASELFSSLKVQKTASAEIDEGSLGATVDLIAGRPFNFKENRLAVTLQDGYYENGGTHNPRIAGLLSRRVDTGIGEFGVLISGAYNKRRQRIDGYNASPGSADYVYRGATFAPNAAIVNGQNRQGFAAPTGTPCSAIIPGSNITNAAVCSALTGSNPATYDLINNPAGSTIANGVVTSAGPLTRFPALPAIQSQEIDQNRLGLTGALQWRPSDRTTISFDGLYSRLKNQSTNYQLVPFGLNRNNTNAGLNTAGANTSIAARRALYATCTARPTTAIQAGIDCGQSLYGSTPVAGTLSGFSFNPNNLEPYDYYNSPSSPGYVADPNGLGMRTAFIGRPSVKLIDGSVTSNGTADYLKLGNVDVSSVTDQSTYTTTFKQYSINLDHEFSDTLSMTALYGRSQSTNDSTGLLAEFTHLNAGQGTSAADYFIYDNRGGGPMPALNVGFDATSPTNWDFVKGYSSLRKFQRVTDNKYEAGRFDFVWKTNSEFTVKFGATRRKFTFSTIQSQRAVADTLNPSLLEANSSVSALSRLTNWGVGVSAPDGTTTSYISPDLNAFQSKFDFTCNCINKWGDFRTSNLTSPANTFAVAETDTGGYVQVDFEKPLFGGTLRGNAGIRYAYTDVVANGLTNTARPVSNDNAYSDYLPSMNLVYEPTSKLLVRFAISKVMARPLLGNLAPSVTSFSAPSTVGATTGGSITLGNTKLNPFRATNYDFSAEWYFASGSLISLALFRKDISSFPQTLVSSSTLTGLLSPDIIAQLRASQTNPAAVAYIDADSPFDVRQFQDAPGGYIQGAEVSFQQNFTFLPGALQYFGVQANYTYLDSKLQYIVDPGAAATASVAARPRVVAPGPFTGASPHSANFTLFYEKPTWSIRGSVAYRGEYYTTYPLSAGSCEPGLCDSPLINDFVGSKSTTNVDASAQWKVTDFFTLTLEALNLTNQTSNRFAYVNDPLTTSYQASGRQVFVGGRFVF